MKFLAALAVAAAATPSLAQLMVSTVAGITQCEPSLLNWSGGTPPYFLSFIPAGQPSGAPIKSFPTTNSTSITWVADLPAGSTFTIQLRDDTGTTVYSDIETVNSSSDSSCINTSVTEGATGSAGPTVSASVPAGTTAPGASTTPGGSSPAASTSGAAGSTGSSSHSSSSSATSSGSAPAQTSHNAAPKTASLGAFGVAGLMGLVGAALF